EAAEDAVVPEHKANDTTAEGVAAEPKRATTAEPPRFGVLSLVVRERNRWTGRAVGWLASWNSWTWRPGASGSANETYLAGLFILAFTVALIRGVLLNAAAYLAATATLNPVTRLRRA